MKKGKVLALLSLSVLTGGVVLGGVAVGEGGFLSELEAGYNEATKKCGLHLDSTSLVKTETSTYLKEKGSFTRLYVNGTATVENSKIILKAGSTIYTNGDKYVEGVSDGSILNGLESLTATLTGNGKVYAAYSNVNEASFQQYKEFTDSINISRFDNNVAPRYLAINATTDLAIESIDIVANMSLLDVNFTLNGGTYIGDFTFNDNTPAGRNIIIVDEATQTITFPDYDYSNYEELNYDNSFTLYPIGEAINDNGETVNRYVTDLDDKDSRIYDLTIDGNNKINIVAETAFGMDWQDYKINFDGGEPYVPANKISLTNENNEAITELTVYKGETVNVIATSDGNDGNDVKLASSTYFKATPKKDNKIAIKCSKANKTTTLTVSSHLNPHIKATLKLSCVERPIPTIDMPAMFANETFKVFDEESYANLIITFKGLTGYINVTEEDIFGGTLNDYGVQKLVSFVDDKNAKTMTFTYENLVLTLTDKALILTSSSLTTEFAYVGFEFSHTDATIPTVYPVLASEFPFTALENRKFYLTYESDSMGNESYIDVVFEANGKITFSDDNKLLYNITAEPVVYGTMSDYTLVYMLDTKKTGNSLDKIIMTYDDANDALIMTQYGSSYKGLTFPHYEHK